MGIVLDYLKQYKEDIKFVDDLAVKNTPTAKNMRTAVKNDRKLAKLTSKHRKRLLKKYPNMHRLSAARRGTELYARYCAWDELHPESLLHDSIWFAVNARLKEIYD